MLHDDKLIVCGEKRFETNNIACVQSGNAICDRNVSWISGPKLPLPLAGFSLLAVDNDIVCIGGTDRTDSSLSKRVFKWTPGDSSWMPLHDTKVAISNFGSAVIPIFGNATKSNQKKIQDVEVCIHLNSFTNLKPGTRCGNHEFRL